MQPNCRIFQLRSNKVSLPKNGLFIKVNKSQEYLLTTTGLPDTSEEKRGLPNPIFIQIYGKYSEEILQLIYDLTFYNPYYFHKTNLPFVMTMLNEFNIYNKLPTSFREGNPF